MSQKKGDSKFWYGLAASSVVAASVSAVSLLYLNYRKNVNEKDHARRQKREKKSLANQKKKEKKKSPANQKKKEKRNTNGQEGHGQDNENQPTTQTRALIHEEKAKGATDQEKSGVKSMVDEQIGNEGLSKENLVNFLKDLCEEMVIIIQQISHLTPPDDMKSYEDKVSALNMIYQDEVEKIRNAFLAKYKTTDEQCSHALMKYKEDEEIMKICLQIERLNKSFVAEPLTQTELDQIPESFTVDRLISMMGEMNSKMMELQQQIYFETQALQNTLSADELQKQQRMLFEKRTQQFQQEILAKHEVDEDIVALAMNKYRENAKLQTFLMDLQQKQGPT